ncbi:MAG: SCP2 sterol-binding domain-containing protein [Janthinobacterium lividum]
MSETQEIIEIIKEKRELLSTLGHRVRIDLKDAGSILVDATKPDVAVTEADEDTEADTTITLSSENMQKLLTGKLNAMWAYTLGQLKIEGSQSVALKLSSLLKEQEAS